MTRLSFARFVLISNINFLLLGFADHITPHQTLKRNSRSPFNSSVKQPSTSLWPVGTLVSLLSTSKPVLSSTMTPSTAILQNQYETITCGNGLIPVHGIPSCWIWPSLIQYHSRIAYGGTVLFRQNQLRRLFVTGCRVLNTNPRANAYFIAFIIGEHAVLENRFIHLAFYTKLTSSSRLF